MNNKAFLTILSLVLFLGLYNPLNAGFDFFRLEKSANPEIDSLLQVANHFYEIDNYDLALQHYNNIVEKSEKENYSKGLTQAYIGYASIYFIQNKLDVSTSYLLKAKEQPYANENPEEMYNISFREGLNLHSLGLYDEAVKKYKESIAASNKITDREDKLNKLVGVYINIGDIFQLKNERDSAFYYYKNAYNSQTTNLNNKFTSSISISELYVENGELDSARKYLGFAKYYAEKLNSDFTDAVLSQINGKYLSANGNFSEAIISYKKSLILNEKLDRSSPALFKLLSEAYHEKGEDKLSNAYLKRYVEVKDSLEEAKKRNLKVPILIANKDNANKIQKAESNTQLVIVSFGGIILLIFLIVYLYVKKQKKKTVTRRNENIQLKKKLNNAFDEVADLAATNSPNFLSRFIEVYPEFYNQLISEYPNLTTADLKLCALMKLDFSTKEIAEISFSSLRTVQNRKYKLRKKFGLETEENINQWIQNIQIQSLVPA
ncbi:tetratricopeptide repeat protein [Moheibacter sediminis]|uniref:Uncharacterized protein n=1 Tax=Moheibacter sediminis TaxID=1434700 RepID=A0A1W1Y886_9FLAO|nr:hypothetical protein [Moheibacter sediminis]SMC32382.1 hypothetical protein SAMN06296427_10179 [Moheibacter sediminis]